MRWCDQHGLFYVFGLARNPRLERELKPTMEAAQAACEATAQKQRLFTEFLYAAQTWDRPRRVIGKAEYSSQGANPRFVVTNLSDPAATLYDDRYCPRGDMENRIKEQQLCCSPIAPVARSCSRISSACCSRDWLTRSWTACVDWVLASRPKANGNPRRSASGSSKWPPGCGSLPDESSFNCRPHAPPSLSSDASSSLFATADNTLANAIQRGGKGVLRNRSPAFLIKHPQTENNAGQATDEISGLAQVRKCSSSRSRSVILSASGNSCVSSLLWKSNSNSSNWSRMAAACAGPRRSMKSVPSRWSVSCWMIAP